MAGQLLTTATAILKESYLPLFNDLIAAEPTPFLEMIGKKPLPGGGDIVAAARYGINGGFGMSSEGAPTPTSFAQMYKRLKTTAKDMYCDIGISEKTITLANEDKNAFLNSFKDEVKGAYIAAKWNTGRMMFGNGIGKLGSFAAALTGVTTVTLDTVSYVTEGLAIDFRTINGGTIALVATSVRRILYVNRVAKTITIDAAITTLYGGFICVQGSYEKELTGLGAIFDTTNVATIYGVPRAGNEWVNPYVRDADHDMTSRFIFQAVKDAKDFRGALIDTIMMGNDAFAAWYDYMEEMHTPLTPTTLKYKSGAAGFVMVCGDHVATIYNEPFVPATKTWCVQKDLFDLYSTPWKFAEHDTGGAFTLAANSSNYRALLDSYGDLMCELPGGCLELINCNNLEKILVTGISVSPATKTFSGATAGATQQITVTLTPSGVTVSQVKFTSSNVAIATVSDTGLITSVANGTCVIGCSTVDGGFTAYVAVTVSGIA